MKMATMRAVIALLLAALVGWGSIAPAVAQTAYTDKQLTAFVDAAVAVDRLIEKWQPKVSDAKNPEEAQKLRDQANAEIVGAVEKTPNMSVDQYKQIGEAAQKDPALNARIEKIYQDKVTR